MGAPWREPMTEIPDSEQMRDLYYDQGIPNITYQKALESQKMLQARQKALEEQIIQQNLADETLPSIRNDYGGPIHAALNSQRMRLMTTAFKDKFDEAAMAMPQAMDDVANWATDKYGNREPRANEMWLNDREPLAGESRVSKQLGPIGSQTFDSQEIKKLKDPLDTGGKAGQLAGTLAAAPAVGMGWGLLGKGAGTMVGPAYEMALLPLLQKIPKYGRWFTGEGASLASHIKGMAEFEAGMAGTDFAMPVEFQEQHPGMAAGLEMAGGMLGPGAVSSLARKRALRGLVEDQVPGFNPLKSEVLANERGSIQVGNKGSKDGTLWQRTGGKLTMKVVDKLVDAPLVSTKGPFKGLPKALGGNTLRQWFIHPMDRMDPMAGRAFQDLITSKQQTQEALGGLATQFGNMNMADRQAVMTAIKSPGFDSSKLPAHLQEKLGPGFEQLRQAVGLSTQKVGETKASQKAIERSLRKGVAKVFAANHKEPLFQVYMDVAKENKYDLSTARGTRKFLEYLSQSAEPEAITKLANDYLRLTAKTGSELARVTKGAYESALVRRVKESQWARPRRGATDLAEKGPYPNDGHKWLSIHDRMESKALRQLKGFEVRDDVVEGFLDFEKTYSAGRALYNTYFLAPWKTAKVLWNPAARVRDLTSNFIFNDVAGKYPLSIFNVKHYTQSLMDMKKGTPLFKKFLEESGGSFESLMNIDPGPVLQALQSQGSVPGAVLGLIYNPGKSFGIKGTVGKIADGALNAPAKYTHFMADKAKFADAWAKYAKYKWNLGKGMESKDAVIDALRTVGDHNRQTQAIKLVRDWAMPFAGWQAHAVKTMGWGLINHPVRTAKYFAIPYAMQQAALDKLNISDEDWTYFKNALPDYVKDDVMGIPTHVPLPFRDEKGRMQFMDISWWIPGLQDLGEVGRSAGTLTGLVQNPALSLFAALKSNKTFSGAPIYYEWEPNKDKARKTFAYIWQQMSPSFVPGGHVWERVARVGDTDPDAPTALQASGPMVGWRVKGYDEGSTIDRYQGRLDAHERQARSAMDREMQRAGNDPKRMNQAIQTYQEVMMDIARKRVGE